MANIARGTVGRLRDRETERVSERVTGGEERSGVGWVTGSMNKAKVERPTRDQYYEALELFSQTWLTGFRSEATSPGRHLVRENNGRENHQHAYQLEEDVPLWHRQEILAGLWFDSSPVEESCIQEGLGLLRLLRLLGRRRSWRVTDLLQPLLEGGLVVGIGSRCCEAAAQKPQRQKSQERQKHRTRGTRRSRTDRSGCHGSRKARALQKSSRRLRRG